MRYFFLAGEASGDLHSGNLARELHFLDDAAMLCGWGGDQMKSAGVDILTGLDRLSFMGFWEVVKKLPEIFRLFRKIKKDISTFRPDVVVLVDYPGFNLRLAKWLKKEGYKVAWYISPQLWAWRPGRVKIIRDNVDLLMVILPFEAAFYAQHGVKAHYVGHPLMDMKIEQLPTQSTNTSVLPGNSGPIALLPGSRKQEIVRLLPVMLETAALLGQEKFVIAGLSSLGKSIYKEQVFPPNVSIEYDHTYEILSASRAALVTSGTATLETAMLGIPQVVVYKGSRISFLIARQLVKVPFISLVNLITGKAVVPELIQQTCTADNIRRKLLPLLSGSPEKDTLLKGYELLYAQLGKAGASRNAAELLVEFALNKKVLPKKQDS